MIPFASTTIGVTLIVVSLARIDANVGPIRLPSLGTGEEVIELLELKVFPDPPAPGKNLTVTAYGKVREEIEVKLTILHILHHLNPLFSLS
jgi:hypothetical protein